MSESSKNLMKRLERLEIEGFTFAVGGILFLFLFFFLSSIPADACLDLSISFNPLSLIFER